MYAAGESCFFALVAENAYIHGSAVGFLRFRALDLYTEFAMSKPRLRISEQGTVCAGCPLFFVPYFASPPGAQPPAFQSRPYAAVAPCLPQDTRRMSLLVPHLAPLRYHG